MDQPVYLKSTVILFGLILFCYVIYLGHAIIIPIAFSGLLAVLLNPVELFLERYRVPRLLAITLSVLLAIIMVGLLGYLLSTQIEMFTEAVPRLRDKISELLVQFQNWLAAKYNISAQKQIQWVNQAFSSATQNTMGIVGTTLSTVTGVLVLLTLIPVYVFLFLYYRVLLQEFIIRIFRRYDQERVREIVHETKTVIQSYVVGLLIEACIMAALNTIGLLILGVPYAIILGVIGAMLNVIPYVGGIVAILLPIIIALASGGGMGTILGILAVYGIIQFIDNNFLVPYIVASKVSLNALVSIIAVLIGGALAGVSGMFLSIPFVAILKVIFDRVEDLKPWGMLLGDVIPGDEDKSKKNVLHSFK